MENGFEKIQELGNENSTDARKEDDEVASDMGRNEKKSQSQDGLEEVVVDNFDKFQNLNTEASRVGPLEVTQEHGEQTTPTKTCK
ncbi:hypothetical protein SLA2020_481660 [Shorea laevis]